jgi:hypothetical protein
MSDAEAAWLFTCGFCLVSGVLLGRLWFGKPFPVKHRDPQ